jgi:phosphoribosyl 1,2-cyclic phosphate phosphodiesterase
MQIEFLGTAGATPSPVPGVNDATNLKAQTIGVPYSRYGPCVYVHGPELMIDTSEETRLAMLRAGIEFIPHCIYSHWHPDHVLGCRVFELNRDWFGYPPHPRTTQVYLPQQVAKDAREQLGFYNSLMWYQRWRWVNVNEMRDGDTLTLNGACVTPLRLAQDLAYAFLIQQENKRALIVPDEVHGWQPPSEAHDVDVLVITTGLFACDPISGAQRWHPDHPILRFEPSFEDVLHIVEQIAPRRTCFTHLEVVNMPDDDALRVLARQLSALKKYGEVTFAYDTLKVEV